jgi:hypothetical protein
MRAYRGLGRNRIGRIGPHRISAQLPIRSKYNRIGDFIGNYRNSDMRTNPSQHWQGKRQWCVFEGAHTMAGTFEVAGAIRTCKSE